MKIVYAGDIVPLLPAMLAGAAVDQGEGSAQPAEPHHTPVDPIPSTSQLPHSPHPSPQPHSPLHQSPPHSPLHHSPYQSPPHSPHHSPPHFSPPRSYEAPLPEGNTSGSAEDSVQLKELMVLVPKLVTRINSLEKELKDTKQTLGNAVLKLVKKVKTLETTLKRKSKKVLISESEGEESEDQGRKFQDIDDDPLVSLVHESIKAKSTDFVTPTKASREAHKEEISPTILEAAKTLSKIDTRLDAEEEINTGREEINTGIEEVSTGSTKVDSGTASERGQREEKASMVEEDIQATHKTKEQLRQEEAGVEEAIKIKFEEIKEEFDKLVQQIDTFVPINLEATKEKLKRYGEELQKKTLKKQRIDDKDVPAIGEKVAEVKKEEQVKRTGKRKKQKARKGVNVDKSTQEDSEESVEAMNPTPLTTKSDSVANWKIFQQGQRSSQEMWEAIERIQLGESLIIQDVKTNLFWEFVVNSLSRWRETMESDTQDFYQNDE
ncbi:hypothetical protein Tco_1100506 [Tanacetum coccineum]